MAATDSGVADTPYGWFGYTAFDSVLSAITPGRESPSRMAVIRRCFSRSTTAAG
ncbi:hypothetical protein D3C85_1509830 [compost metagenome]